MPPLPAFSEPQERPTKDMEGPHSLEGVLVDPVDFVIMDSQLQNAAGQVGWDLVQQIVGQVEQLEMLHVPEGLWMDLGDLVVDQEQSLGAHRRGRHSNNGVIFYFSYFCITRHII